jgi:hypothetical protein
MDDADLAGPLFFSFGFGMVLLFVRSFPLTSLGPLVTLSYTDEVMCVVPRVQSGKPQFSYIYGVALLGITAIYTLLNLMSERGIDAYRTASVLGYCLLPMVGLGTLGMGVGMECVHVVSLSSLPSFLPSFVSFFLPSFAADVVPC